jgi:CubicO group peptidase (beta-lactamase class C family)
VLVARASGKALEAFLRERIFEPLGMKDTSFGVPKEKCDRLVTSYFPKDPFGDDAGGHVLYDAVGGDWSKPPAFPSGGGGLASTLDDYLAFGRMLLGRGALGGTRVLSAASVDMMTKDHLTAAEKAISPVMPEGHWKNHGWGFGLEVTTGADAYSAIPGRYGWDGGLGTSWRNDPTTGMVGVLLTQVAAFPGAKAVYRDFWAAAYR